MVDSLALGRDKLKNSLEGRVAIYKVCVVAGRVEIITVAL